MALCLISCSEKVDTAAALADQFQKHGVQVASQGPADNVPRPPRVTIDEAIELKGENLHVEILRVEDENSRKMLMMAMATVALADKFTIEKTGDSLPGRPLVYTSGSLIVVVREEPVEGRIKTAMEEIFDN